MQSAEACVLHAYDMHFQACHCRSKISYFEADICVQHTPVRQVGRPATVVMVSVFLHSYHVRVMIAYDMGSPDCSRSKSTALGSWIDNESVHEP